MGDLTALRVSPAEEAEAYGLLVACSAWLRSKGSAQWAVPYPRERFARDVAAGTVRSRAMKGFALARAKPLYAILEQRRTAAPQAQASIFDRGNVRDYPRFSASSAR